MKNGPKLRNVLILMIACSVLTGSFTVFFQLKKDIRIFTDQKIEEREQQSSSALSEKFGVKVSALTSLAVLVGGRQMQNDPSAAEALRFFAKNGSFVQTAIADLIILQSDTPWNRSPDNRSSIDRIHTIISRSEKGTVLCGEGASSRYLLCGIPVLGTAAAFLLLGIYAVILLRRKNSDVKKRIQELEISNERYQIVLDQSDSMIFEYDILNSAISSSTSCLYMFGGSQTGGRNIIENFPESILKSDIIHPDDLSMFRSIFASVSNGAHNAEGECRLKDQNGSYLWYSIKITTIFNKNGEPVRAIGRISDITCQKEATQKLVQSAQRDGLTGLLNKSATKTYIEQALVGNELCALYIIDIDHFKEINDNLGHMFGDAVLAEIGNKLKKLFRTSDVVGRVGGDEFMVLLKNINHLSLIMEKATVIHQCLQQTFVNGSKNYSISGSIGIAVYPKDGMTYSDLYKKADAALYKAKRCGRSQFVVFDSSLEMPGNLDNTPDLEDFPLPR